MEYYSFPTNLKKYRKRRNLTQEQLAKKLGISRSMLSMYETSIIYPTLDRVYDIARILDVEVADLLKCRESTAERTKYIK